MAVTMQAVSGAGYPGVASLDILGNVIPYIPNEEEKMEEETRKLLGQLNGSKVIPGTFAMSAQCNRVAVEDGHTESVSVRLKTKAKAGRNHRRHGTTIAAEPQQLKLPSAPEKPVVYVEASDRPQPRFDVDTGRGHDHGRRPPASLRRARLEVHRALAQHHPRSRRRRRAQRRTAQGQGIPGMKIRQTLLHADSIPARKPRR